MLTAITRTPTSRQVLEGSGYTTDIRLEPRELEFFRAAITEQWHARIKDLYPDLAPRFAELGVPNYHQLAHLVDHEKLWPKQYRVLPAPVTRRAKDLPVFTKLKQAFGPFEISDVVYGSKIEKGREEFYWRIVRPSQASDVGGLHADKWFHEALGPGETPMFPAGTTTIKIWTAIYCEPGKSGLIVVPDSHRRNWRYRQVRSGSSVKPQFADQLEPSPGVLVPTEPGTLLVFNEGTLHGGAVNQGDQCRVSMEITMVFRP